MRLTIKIPRPGVGQGAGGGGGGGGRPVHWAEECPRKGDRVRENADSSIGTMPCQQGSCPSCDGRQGSNEEGGEGGAGSDEEMDVDAQSSSPQTRSTAKGKAGKLRKKKEVGWCEDPNGGPPITKAAGNFLATLLHIWNSKGRHALDNLLKGPTQPPTSPSSSSTRYDPTDTAHVLKHLDRLTEKSHILDLEHMLALIQLALNIDRFVISSCSPFLPLLKSLGSEIQGAALKHKFLGKSELARKYTKSEKARTSFCERVSWGQRFAFLCGAGEYSYLFLHLMK